MTTVDTIVEAIEGHRTLNFGYHGFDRVVSPYAIGMTTTNELKMLAYQTEAARIPASARSFVISP